MPYKGYDNKPENASILLDLPFYEGVGMITNDQAKPHHPMTMKDPGTGSFSWDALPSGLGVLTFVTTGGGPAAGVHLDSPAADTADLNFRGGDYSIGGWTKWQSDGFSEIVIGRYGTDLDGWDCFFNAGSFSLSLRHNHASRGPNFSSQCFSSPWGVGVWNFFGISRLGASLYPLMYKNGVAITMSYEATGMLDPDTCNRDLVVGCRNTKDANWFKGSMWGLRVWNRALSAANWRRIFKKERAWFGV